MNKIMSLLGTLLLLTLIVTGTLGKILDFFIWLICMSNTGPEISLIGQLIVRVVTFALSFALVGFGYKCINYHSKDLMSVSYFIVSTILSLLISYLIWLFETYTIYILIGLGTLVFVSIIFFIYEWIKNQEVPA